MLGRTRPPLLAGRVLYPDEAWPDLAHLILANPTAGILAGDRLAIRVRVRAGGRAHLTTQVATRLHPMEHGAAKQRIDLHVEPDALLEWFPDPTIPFRDARFSQNTTLTVAPGGTLLYSDILTPNRVAMGESLAYTRLHNRLTVQTPAGPPLYREAFSLLPQHRPLLGHALFGPSPATLGTHLVVTDAAPPQTLRDAIRADLAAHHPAVRWGIAFFPNGGGLAVKALGPETQHISALLRTVWASVRRELWGVELPPIRKY